MRLLSIFAVSLLLSGCLATATRTQSEYKKTNRVDLVRFDHEVAYRNGSRAPSTAEIERLDAFLANIQAGEGDTILLSGGAPEQRKALGLRLVRRRLSVYQTQRNGAPGRVSVLVERYIVTPPNCPDWSKPVGEDYENSPRASFGCANTANLGMMVANPRDLVRGRTPGPADAEAVSAAIRRYRAGKITPLEAEDSTGEKSSSGGAQ